ncbi:PEP-CTERM sorting domain-containing protein [Janthinobacterium sp. BJB426]|uniref:PEP-CTERM sorting domain-containing protein n=1 Tax=Janthinobacterium sp. BJB426 TaxID=2048010 RepID=UPI001F22319C|nr:PEP-CTERM sorting domain-containing protein [Janthinobacterium sp. BJB426]
MSLHTIIKIALTNIALCASFHVQATTFSNEFNSGELGYLGAIGVVTYGETFTSPGGVLNDFTLYASSGYGTSNYGTGYIGFGIAAWDGTKAVGPALYTSAPMPYSGKNAAFEATGLNLALPLNKEYVAYLTVAGIENPVHFIRPQGSNNNGGLTGNHVYSNAKDPLNASQPWGVDKTVYMRFTANFTNNTIPVPEPETYAMLLAGLGIVGFAGRRRLKSA